MLLIILFISTGLNASAAASDVSIGLKQGELVSASVDGKSIPSFDETLMPSPTPKPAQIPTENRNNSIPSKTPFPSKISSLGATPSIMASIVNYNTVSFQVNYIQSGIYGNRLEMWNSVMGWVDVSKTFYTTNGTYSVTNLAAGSYMGRLTYLNNGVWVTIDQWIQLPVYNAVKSYSYSSTSLQKTYISNPAGNSKIEYVYDKNGNLVSRKKVAINENWDHPSKVNVTDSSYKITVFNVPSAITSVSFPTWTLANGQDDIHWYEGVQIAPNTWQATIVLSSHNHEIGQYVTHLYLNQGATSTLFGQTVTEVVASNVLIVVPSEVRVSNDSYEVQVSGIGENVAKVLFPTWTASNGQDDLETPWIGGQKISSDTWKISIPFHKHNFETGIYNTHLYSFDELGNSTYVGAITTNAIPGTNAPVSTSISNVSYDITVFGVSPSAERVYFPTWSAHNGQDDIVWHEGVKLENGVWRVTIPFSTHHFETGVYTTHIYSQQAGNQMTMISNSETLVNASEVQIQSPTNVNVSNGSYDILVSGLNQQVANVRFPTWTAGNGQDDLENPWLLGQELTPGTWKVTILLNKHNNERGAYYTHIYAYDRYGNETLISMVTTNIV